MGQGDGEVVTPLSCPGWTRGRWLEPGLVSGIGGGGNRNDEDPFDAYNKSFLETATLSSHSGSLSQHRPSQAHERDVGDRPHAYRAHAYAHANTSMPVQACAQPQIQRPATAYDLKTGRLQDLGDQSFLLSRQTSAATMALTTSSTEGPVDATNMHLPPLSGLQSLWHQDLKVELYLPRDPQASDEHRIQPQNNQGLLDSLDNELLLPDTTIFTPSADRPSSSRSHLLHWRRNRSPGPDNSKYLRVSSDGPPSSPTLEESSRPSMLITREEFEALPPTIQRKYFTTIERSQLAHPPDPAEHIRLETDDYEEASVPQPVLAKPTKRRRHHKNRATSDSPIPSPRRSRITSTDQRFYASLPEKIKRQHLTEEEQLAAHYRRQTLILDDPNEASLKVAKRQPKDQKIQSPLASPALSEGHSSLSSMPPHDDHVAPVVEKKKKADSFYDSFRWLEEDEGLDLRLYLDDYHINLREEVPVPNRSRRPSFRRHLSINKLPFGRGSMSYSRPPTVPTSPTLVSPSQSPDISSSVHGRRRSRAMSLISPNKQPLPSMAPTIDPGAAHYQDPEARMKLRVYLASPQKFDEAIEFGFPSVDGARAIKGRDGAESSEKFRSFLEDDRSSAYSDGLTIADPDSPKTPHMFDKPVFSRPVRRSMERNSERSTCVVSEASRDQLSSREMTLRMTLTRPDLRANEEQIYGWKQPGARNAPARQDGTTSPLIYARDENRKESIERQLAAMDRWTDDLTPENGVVKRMWNRVRRS
ncbi:hypothetical protein B0J13DRAFT_31149 [Dactylonectria estremocensis]|uniref:Mucin n=1 Tax=Dactylonectria estremocensis TaxID=1079267 RepID=A0A9P9JLK0_9HYPO|nr:hypothetical protein B0J13DRAFT_31149 [Dactylonectria estremocensis]